MVQYRKSTALVISQNPNNPTIINLHTSKDICVNISIANNGATTANLTLTATGISAPSRVDYIPSASNYLCQGVECNTISIYADNPATIAIDVSYPELIWPNFFNVAVA